jgi:hypothetical protein
MAADRNGAFRAPFLFAAPNPEEIHDEPCGQVDRTTIRDRQMTFRLSRSAANASRPWTYANFPHPAPISTGRFPTVIHDHRFT